MICPHVTQKEKRVGNLPSSVVNLSEEISIIILGSISVLSQPQAQDEVVTGEKDGKKTKVVNSEPLVGSLGGHGGGGGKDGGHESSCDGGDCLHGIGLLDGREGGLDNWGCNSKSGEGTEKKNITCEKWYFRNKIHRRNNIQNSSGLRQ